VAPDQTDDEREITRAVRAVRAGNEQAYAIIIKRFQGPLMTLCTALQWRTVSSSGTGASPAPIPISSRTDRAGSPRAGRRGLSSVSRMRRASAILDSGDQFLTRLSTSVISVASAVLIVKLPPAATNMGVSPILAPPTRFI
jgi:hypothetical protein